MGVELKNLRVSGSFPSSFPPIFLFGCFLFFLFLRLAGSLWRRTKGKGLHISFMASDATWKALTPLLALLDPSVSFLQPLVFVVYQWPMACEVVKVNPFPPIKPTNSLSLSLSGLVGKDTGAVLISHIFIIVRITLRQTLHFPPGPSSLPTVSSYFTHGIK